MRPRFAASDLQAVTGRFHTVACIDVLIHYPQARLPSVALHKRSCMLLTPCMLAQLWMECTPFILIRAEIAMSSFMPLKPVQGIGAKLSFCGLSWLFPVC